VPIDLLRAKGELSIAGSDERHILQVVYELYEVLPTTKWQADDPERHKSRLLFVGQGFDRAQLLSSLSSCLL